MDVSFLEMLPLFCKIKLFQWTFSSLLPLILSYRSFFWIFSGDFIVNEGGKSGHLGDWANQLWYKNILIPIVTLLPLVIRFNQCLRKFTDSGDRLPHLANAGKYALGQMVSLTGAFHPLYLGLNAGKHHRIPVYQVCWTILYVVSALYSFSWDVYMVRGVYCCSI